MANVKSMEVEGNKVRVLFEMSKDEWAALRNETKDVCLFSLANLDETLTTGTIGNSNRIMVPNRLLRRHNITHLPKHAGARVLALNGKKVVVIQLQDNHAPMPRFEES